MLDHLNLLFRVIGSTICLTLCQWYNIHVLCNKYSALDDILS